MDDYKAHQMSTYALTLFRYKTKVHDKEVAVGMTIFNSFFERNCVAPVFICYPLSILIPFLYFIVLQWNDNFCPLYSILHFFAVDWKIFGTRPAKIDSNLYILPIIIKQAVQYCKLADAHNDFSSSLGLL